MMARRQRAFTLVELTVALALVAVLMGLVIVRWGALTPRQRLVREARELGNLIEQYRERAMLEGAVYVLSLERETGRYEVRKPDERTLARLDRAPVVRSGTLEGAHVKATTIQNKQAPGPLVLTFDARGVQPAWVIQLAGKDDSVVTLRIDPLVNEVAYDEQ